MTPTRSMIASESDPRAPILSSAPNPHFLGALVVTVACPHCERTHTHGLPDGDPSPEDYRVAHCGINRGYLITDGPVQILNADLYEDAPCDSTGAPMVYLPCLFCTARHSKTHRPGCPGKDAEFTTPAPEGWSA